MATPRSAYYGHKWDAGKRGIEFHFTFEEWVKWWEENLGPDWLKKRGPHTGQYVMARYEDKGPYVAWNVECITVELNHLRYNVNRKPQTKKQRPKLTKEQVAKIFTSPLKYAEIAQNYNVDVRQVSRIKRRMYYCDVTDKL